MSNDVFLSHNSRDKTSVRELRSRLEEANISTWMDEVDLVAGRPWLDAIEKALQETRCVIIAIGPNGMGPWETPEIRAALIQMVRRGIPVVPLFLPGAPLDFELPLMLQTVSWIDCRNGFSEDSTNQIRKAIDQTQVDVQQKPQRKRTIPSGISAFAEYCREFHSSVSFAAKIGVWLPILPILLGLEPPWDGANKLQEKVSVGIVTLLAEMLAVTGVYGLLRKQSALELRQYFKLSLVAAILAFALYVFAFLFLTEVQPGTHTRLVAGFAYTNEFYQVLQVNNNDMAQTKMDFGHEPFRIYVRWTIWVSEFLVMSSWLLLFGSLVFYLGSFVHAAKDDRPLTDDRAIVVLQIDRKVRELLHDQGIEKVSDLCAMSDSRLMDVVGNSDQAYREIVKALEQYGLVLLQ